MKILVIILLSITASFCYGECDSFECQINAILNKYPNYNKEAMQELTALAQQNSENLRIMQNMGPVWLSMIETICQPIKPELNNKKLKIINKL